MQALKALVIGMGVLIVLAVFLLGYGLYKRTVEPDWKLFGPQSSSIEANSPLSRFSNVTLGLNSGCRITAVAPDGPRLYVSIGGIDGCDEIIVVAVHDGSILGRITP